MSIRYALGLGDDGLQQQVDVSQRTPLVLGDDGIPQQLQSGDSLVGGGSGSAAPSWLPKVIAGLSITTFLMTLFSEAAGVALSVYYFLTMLVTNGIAVVGQFAGTILPAQGAGVLQTVLAFFGAAPQAPAAKIVSITWNLAGDYGATSATASHPSGNTDWTNPSNATGTTNGVNATIASSLTAAIDAVLTLAYAALTNKTALTITQVQVKFYASLTKSLLGAPSLILRYSLNGTSYTVLQTVTASSTGPFLFDVTPAVGGSWANLQNLKTQVEFTSTVGDTGSSATCDSVEFLVSANTTQVP